MSKILAGQVALVTGGSRGIGRAICEKFAELGAHVVVNYSSRADAAEDVVKSCQQLGATAEISAFNVDQSEAVDLAFDKIKKDHGKLDILVNNAGISRDGLLVRFRNEDWDSTLAVNLSGSFYCARAAAKIMMRARTGRIVNVSSVVGEMGNAGQAAYVSSKAGLIGLTKSMARELASRQICVNAVTPGFIETDMTSELPEDLKQQHFKMIPLERYGKAQEIAGLVAFLCSPEASYITGQVIGVNGGMYM